MPKYFYSEFYGRLALISRARYMHDRFAYVCTEEDPDSGMRFDIVICLDDGEYYFTVI